MSTLKRKISRRILLRGTTLAAIGSLGLGLIPIDADAKPTMTQHQAHYQSTPKAGHQCSGCSHFVAPNACNLVKGTISPNGWCMMWAPKG